MFRCTYYGNKNPDIEPLKWGKALESQEVIGQLAYMKFRLASVSSSLVTSRDGLHAVALEHAPFTAAGLGKRTPVCAARRITAPSGPCRARDARRHLRCAIESAACPSSAAAASDARAGLTGRGSGPA